MFIEQKKRNKYRTFIYAAIIVILCLLIVVIAWPAETDEISTAQNNANIDPFGENSSYFENNNSLNEEDVVVDYNDEEEDDDDGDENNDMMVSSDTYYVVKRKGSQIIVFFVDQQGNEIELEPTEIIYNMLGVDDQRLFDEGFVVRNQEELASLLQDFES